MARPLDDDLGALHLVIFDAAFGHADKMQGAAGDLHIVAGMHRLDAFAAPGGRYGDAGDQHADPEMGDCIAPGAARQMNAAGAARSRAAVCRRRCGRRGRPARPALPRRRAPRRRVPAARRCGRNRTRSAAPGSRRSAPAAAGALPRQGCRGARRASARSPSRSGREPQSGQRSRRNIAARPTI